MDFISLVKKKDAVLDGLISGKKKAVLLGGTGPKSSVQAIFPGDVVYFAEWGRETRVVARAIVKDVVNARMAIGADSKDFFTGPVIDKLGLKTAEIKAWSKRKSMRMIEFGPVRPVFPFPVRRPAASTGEIKPVGYIGSIRTA